MNKEIPGYIENYGTVDKYTGIHDKSRLKNVISRKGKMSIPGETKLKTSLSNLMAELDLKDGMTFSFHHHLRNGDMVLSMVMEEVKKLGLKDITIAPSSIFPSQAMLVDLMEDGTVTGIVTNYMSGPVAEAVSKGKLKKPAVMMSHGGRPRAIKEGDLHIDVAFIAAPSSDKMGNINGVNGKSACGALGYAIADANYADIVVAITDDMAPYPNYPIEIHQDLVDYIVTVDSIGDPEEIVSGTTKITKDPIGLKIAKDTLTMLKASGLLKDGMSFQTGAGGISLAVAKELETYMKEKGIVGSFASGGITGYLVNMMEDGLFKALFDVQCFDLEAVRSYRENKNHLPMSGSLYGDPHTLGAIVNDLDIVILGATEIDTDFNVNVTTGSSGTIMGGSGGHQDTAAGAKLTVIVSKLFSARTPLIKDRVTTITTPGETVDVLVTDRGIAVNEKRQDLISVFRSNGLKFTTITELKKTAESFTGTPMPIETDDRIVAVVEYRDGSVIDVVRKVRE
ncbi:MAG: citrate lyase subunit alpha [Clostridiaceae bacterium]